MSLREKARKLTMRIYEPGLSRRKAAKQGKISSARSFDNAVQQVTQYLEWREVNGKEPDTQDRRIDLLAYLNEICEVVGQSALDQARQSLSKVFHMRLANVRSQLTLVL